jgi:hypothetical protein
MNAKKLLVCGVAWLAGSASLSLAARVYPCKGASVFTLAAKQTSVKLTRYELDRDHPSLAAVDRRDAAAHSLGAYPAAGRFVHGLRARTG